MTSKASGCPAQQALRGLRPAHELAPAWAKNWDEVKYCSDACRRGAAPWRHG
jgi:hypothetical protein